MIFILGSPRTGSTLIYQIIINTHNLCYFNNLTNKYFYKHPFISTFASQLISTNANFKSEYGKTKGLFAPSEGSKIFANWFGKQNHLTPDKERLILSTFKNINRFIKNPIVTKNAWNCFRIETLTKLFPKCKFIWIRRDIVQSAISDLKSRYIRGGPYVWNSAPTHDCMKIIKLPYWEQVVEQQYSYNKTIENDLKKYCPDNYIELWYENLCNDLDGQLSDISAFLNMKQKKEITTQFEIQTYDADDNFVKIFEYTKHNINKFKGYINVY